MNQEQRIIESALAQARSLRQRFGSPQIISLSIYASDADLRQLRPEDGPHATVTEQRRIVDAVATALRKDGHLVRMVMLSAPKYLAWLSDTGKANTAAHRAEWISLQTNTL